MGKRYEIYSRNDTYQILETVMHNRNKRLKQGVFAVESVRGINLALSSPGWTVQGVIYAREAQLSSWAQEILARPELDHYILPQNLLQELSDREETSEIILLVRMRKLTLKDITLKHNLILLMDRTQNPGNLGSVIRSADAMGADAVIMFGHSADLYDPACVRATIGTIFTLPVISIDKIEELEALKDKFPGIVFVGTSAHGTVELRDVDFTRPTLLMLGNETVGLSRGCKEACQVLAKIPIFGAASSLNLACAASICLYEAQRQKLFLQNLQEM